METTKLNIAEIQEISFVNQLFFHWLTDLHLLHHYSEVVH